MNDMKEFIEKLIDGLREQSAYSCGQCMDEAIEVVCKIAEEYINTSTDISTNTSTTNAEAYNKGLEDAWKLARKITAASCDGGLAERELYKVFDTPFARAIFKCNTYQEALAKLEAYEKSKEIKVGDVVEEICTGRHFLIITEEEYGMYNLGVIDLNKMRIDRICNDTRYFKKTNKHIDIEKILEQLKGE